jgi:hypothetical protein
MRILIEEAARENKAVTLGVVKTNPARRLYERLGFSVTHEDQYKFYMRRHPDRTRAPGIGCGRHLDEVVRDRRRPSSLLTLRWREPDSNPRSPIG